MNAENLWQPGFRVYFWTFTFRECLPHWEALQQFRKFLNRLRWQIGGDWSGVRVAELHPGGHGVHFHCLINRRLDVNRLRKIGSWLGLGRMLVEVADQNPEGCSNYLAKYLSKSKQGPRCESGRMARRWACFGPRRRTRVSDLVNESPYWVFRRGMSLFWLGFRFEVFLPKCWDYGEACLKSAWFAAKRGEMETVTGLATGRYYADGFGRVVERLRGDMMVATPF